ncbi:MAG: hypothetical protein PHV16_01005 [Candidatus Nanoarchaeia archaeon]|nr:hypothetical protein [Candidatus Nanoarchaeia archaeon]
MSKNNLNENIDDYVEQNQAARYSNKQNTLKQKMSDVYKGLCEAATVSGAAIALYSNYPHIVDFLGKYTGSKNIILNIGLDDIAAAGLSALAVYGTYSIAKNYNPLEKAINGTGKLSYGLSKFGVKSTYNASKFFVDGTRDFVGEIIVAPLSQKLRSKITTKETYESNIEREEQILEHRRNKALKKADNLQSKINKLQKLKINYQDNMVENPGLYSGKIEDANKKLKSLYEQKNSLNPDAI